MNDLKSSRAPGVLGLILLFLVAAALVFPRVVDATTTPEESQVPDNPVELGSIGVPDENGGQLVCSNPSGFAESTKTWDCDSTRILGRSEPTPNNAEKALARFYRRVTLDRNVETGNVGSPREGVHVKRTEADAERTLVAVSIADGQTTRYFSFGGDDAEELAQRLIDSADVNTDSSADDSEETEGD